MVVASLISFTKPVLNRPVSHNEPGDAAIHVSMELTLHAPDVHLYHKDSLCQARIEKASNKLCDLLPAGTRASNCSLRNKS